MIYAGIDVGSRTLKVVLFDSELQAVIGHGLSNQGVHQGTLSRELYERVLVKAGLEADEVAGVVATGYGRNAVDFAQNAITEITCHAAGVRHLCPEARTIIDIGGQDSKVIRLDGEGKVQDFVMNDRCAAGTGRFLEIVAERLETDLDKIAACTGCCANPASISSMCVVFAETEIIGLLASGRAPVDIMAGVQLAIANRMISMVGRHGQGPFVFTGGVALVPGMVEALSKTLEHPVTACPKAQFTGALGAALLAGPRI